jgi:phosphate/phosphite/phosphonate ABC transporter binding protein
MHQRAALLYDEMRGLRPDRRSDMSLFKGITSTVLSLAILALSVPISAAGKETIRVGVREKKADLRKNFGGVVSHLESSESYEFSFVTFDDYDALYEAFKAREVDLALVGAVKYAEAHYETGAIPIVAEGGMVRSMIVVPNDSPISNIKGLTGKSFAMGYEGSTSTHLMPLLLLSKNLVKESDLSRVEFVGSDQDRIVEQILSGSVDAGSIVESVFDRYKDKVRAIETSEPFPGGPLIAHKDTDSKLIEAVRKLFLSYKPVPGQRFGGGAIAVTNADFNQIRFLCKVVLGKSYV